MMTGLATSLRVSYSPPYQHAGSSVTSCLSLYFWDHLSKETSLISLQVWQVSSPKGDICKSPYEPAVPELSFYLTWLSNPSLLPLLIIIFTLKWSIFQLPRLHESGGLFDQCWILLVKVPCNALENLFGFLLTSQSNILPKRPP